jgi:hypothetical protein
MTALPIAGQHGQEPLGTGPGSSGVYVVPELLWLLQSSTVAALGECHEKYKY